MARLPSTILLILSILLGAPEPFRAVAFQYTESVTDFVITGPDRENHSATMHIKSGEGFVEVGKYDSALYHLLAAVKILEKDDNSVLLGNAYSTLGRVFYRLRDPARAFDYYSKAEELVAQHASCNDLSRLYIDMGLVSVDEDRVDRSFDFFHKSRLVCARTCDNSFSMRVNFAEGIALKKKGDVKQAMGRLDSALVIAKDLGDKSTLAGIMVRLSAAYYEAGEFATADELSTEAEIIACGLELKDVLIEVYQQRILLMSVFGNVRGQADYQRRFIELSESLYNEQIMARLAELEIDFMERDNVKVIEQQKQSLILSSQTMVKRQRLILLSAACVVLGTIVVLMLVHAVRRKKQTVRDLVGEVEHATSKLEDRILEKQNEMVSKDVELRASLRRMKADVASLLGICIVASKHSEDRQTKDKFSQLQQDLIELKRRMEKV